MRRQPLAVAAAMMFFIGNLPAFGDDAAESSERILAGLTNIADVVDLPDSINLPNEWVATMRDIAAATTNSKTEQATCLSYTSKSWVAGSLQSGSGDLIYTNFATDGCDKSPLAHVHSHPRGLPVPSDGDLAFALQKPFLKSAFVVMDDEVCGLVKTGESSSTLADDAESFAATYALRHGIWNARHAQVGDLSEAASVTAATSEFLHMGLYCGRVGEVLPRVRPTKDLSDQNDPLLYVVLKGLVLAQATVSGGAIGTLSFTPKLDNMLGKLISDGVTYGPLTEEEATSILSAKTSSEMLRLAAKAFRATSGKVLAYPNNRGKEPAVFYTSFCGYSNVDKSLACAVHENFGTSFESTPTKLMAFYRERDEKTILVRSRPGNKYRREDVGPGKYAYAGACKFSGMNCEPHGKGTVTYDDGSVFKGTFSEGVADGTGIYTDPSDGEVWKANAVKGSIKLIEKIK